MPWRCTAFRSEFYQFQVRIKLSLLYLLSVGLSRLLFGFVSTHCSGNLCLVSHVGFHALLWENSAA